MPESKKLFHLRPVTGKSMRLAPEKKVTEKSEKVVPIPRAAEPKLYALLDDLVATVHSRLEDATIVLAWNYGWHQDQDGILDFARVRRMTELDQRLTKIDFVILLNKEFWVEIASKPKKVRYIFDHELCHCEPRMDKHGQQVKDRTGRLEWRLRRHPVEEFPECVERNGISGQGMLDLANAILRRRNAPLFSTADDDQEEQE